MSDPSPGLPNPLWDKRWSLAARAFLAVVCLGVASVSSGRTWHWDLFGWGVLGGLVVGAVIFTVAMLSIRPPNDTAEHKRRTRRQSVIISGGWVLIGVVAGWGASMADALWPDLAFVAAAVLALTVTAAVVLRVARRQRA